MPAQYPQADLTFENLCIAYFDCRRTKRNTLHQLRFEINLERNLIQLWNELNDGSYQIGSSYAFVVTYPKVREVWAASFRDRIVHHLIYNAVCDRFYARFIRDAYACIPGRGIHDARQRTESFARSITNNGTRNAFALKADIANFFTSINRRTILAQVEERISEEWLRRLMRQVVLHDPRRTAILRSSRDLFDKVPKHKSLWHAPEDFGLPIGNLTSQFLANVHLDALDQFAKHRLKARYYGRYVDDILILDESAETLNDLYNKMEFFLLGQLGLQLHPNKKRIYPIAQGIDFVGSIIKPGRTYLRNMSISRCKQKIRAWEQHGAPVDKQTLLKLAQSVTSYLGMLRHVDGYRARKSLCKNFDNLFIHHDPEYTKIIPM